MLEISLYYSCYIKLIYIIEYIIRLLNQIKTNTYRDTEIVIIHINDIYIIEKIKIVYFLSLQIINK